MKNIYKDDKPVPRVEKYVRKDGTPVHREYHRFDDIPLPTSDEFEELHFKTLLKLTPKRDLSFLEKHFKGGTKSAKPIKDKKSMTFKGLFRDPDNAKKVKDILESRGYTVNGKWQGLTDDKSELLCVYSVLKVLLKPHKTTPVAKLFYTEFGLPENYISDRALRDEPFGQSRKDFEEIFSPLLPSKK